MVFEIKRYHILLLGLLLLGGAWNFYKGTRASPRLNMNRVVILRAQTAQPGSRNSFASSRIQGDFAPAGVRSNNNPLVILRAEAAKGGRSREAAKSIMSGSSSSPDVPVRPNPKKMDLVFLAPNPSKKIAFTFDDGPHPEYTQRLLKILRDHGVRATFFVVGKQVEKHPELLQLIFREGHEIANHTYSHRDLRTLSPEELTLELEKTDRLVTAVTDQKMKYFRPPGGQYSPAVVQSARDLGYEMVLWSIFPQDHTNPAANLIRGRVLKAAKDRGIILLHSGVKHTLEILPDLILSLKSRGYSFVTISELESPDPFLKLAHGKP